MEKKSSSKPQSSNQRSTKSTTPYQTNQQTSTQRHNCIGQVDHLLELAVMMATEEKRLVSKMIWKTTM